MPWDIQLALQYQCDTIKYVVGEDDSIFTSKYNRKTPYFLIPNRKYHLPSLSVSECVGYHTMMTENPLDIVNKYSHLYQDKIIDHS